MIRLVRPTMIDLLALCRDARPDEIEQYEALTGREWDVDEMATDFFTRSGVKFSVFAGPRLLVAGGWMPAAPGVLTSWMIGTPESWAVGWRSITKASRRVMDSLLEHDARRLQTFALASRTKTLAWYEKSLLMQHEGTMRAAGANGEDVVIYSRVRAAEPVEYVFEEAA